MALPRLKHFRGRKLSGLGRRFDSLSPYNREIVPHLLRLTDENYDEKGAQTPAFRISIAAKRYALYTMKCGKPYCSHTQLRHGC